MSGPSALIRFSRWAALGLGLLYGSSHYRAVAAEERAHLAHVEHKRREKEEIDELRRIAAAARAAAGGVITNPEDPAFSLERLIESYSAPAAAAH